MKKKLIIFGCSPFSRVLRCAIEKEADGKVEAYCMTEDYMNETSFDGLRVYPLETLDEVLGKDNFEVLNTVSYRGMNVGRERIFHLCEELGYEIASFIHPNTRVRTDKLGRGNILMENSGIGHFSEIGDGNILWGAYLSHDCVMGNFNFLTGCQSGGLVQMGNNCFVGQNSFICDGISVGNFCLIGAGTTLTRSIEDNTLVMPPQMRMTKGTPEDMGAFFHSVVEQTKV